MAPLSVPTDRLRTLEPVLRARQTLLHALRQFFHAHDYIEVHTPVRVRTPALELHIDAEPSGDHYLRTSPELHMKRLLAAGYRRIYQVGPCFRRGERGCHHHPEYTMLEWYRAEADHLDILAETKDLLRHLAAAVAGGTTLVYQGHTLDLGAAWDQSTISEMFQRYAGWDPVAALDPDRFDLDLTEKVVPALPRNRPVVLMDYPAPLAAMARLSPSRPGVAERWELYLAGLEIANAYSELVDADEQRARFDLWAAQRRAGGRPVYEVDEAFMSAMESGMPPAGGIALGIDRLMMILLDKADLADVMAFAE